jgi:8-oxo-dGTP diphosphatase
MTSIINFILFIVAFALVIVLVPIAYFYSVFFHWKKLGRLKYEIAFSLDQFGNTACQHLFNDALIIPRGYKFGNPDETISSVLGKNKRDNTLSSLGIFISFILDTIDENHVLKSIDNKII